MDEKSFWLLIDESRDKSRGETSSDRADDQAMQLTEILKKLPADEIREFDRIFQVYRARAYRHDLWGAAYLVQGGCSDAWCEVTGKANFPFDISEHPSEPVGEPWEEDDLPKLFPKLFEKYGW